MSVIPTRTPAVTRRAAPLALALAAGLVACAALLAALATPATARAAALAEHAYPGCGDTLQECIDDADPGDTIVIAAGTHITSFTLNKAVSLTAGAGGPVVLHALPNTRVLTVTGALVDSSVVISGLTFTGGSVTAGVSCPASCGGGVLIDDSAAPRLINVTVSGNRAWRGGGLHASNAAHVWQDVAAISNTSDHHGGGVFAGGQLLLSGLRLQGNQCEEDNCWGGGLYAQGPLTLTDASVLNNQSRGHGAGVFVVGAAAFSGGIIQQNQCSFDGCLGGGLYAINTLQMTGTHLISNTVRLRGGGVEAQGAVILSGVLLRANQCAQADCLGGGLHAFSDVTLNGARFIDNFANGAGGGLYAASGLTAEASEFRHNWATGDGGGLLHAGGPGKVVNSLFAGNTTVGGAGAALHLASPEGMLLLHNTIAAPSALAVAAAYVASGTVGFTNTLFSNYGIAIQRAAGSAYQDYSLFANVGVHTFGVVAGGLNSITGTAGFADPAVGDYRLTHASDARDAGADNAGVPADAFGAPRPLGAGFDIGYHELDPVRWLYLPLVVRNP